MDVNKELVIHCTHWGSGDSQTRERGYREGIRSSAAISEQGLIVLFFLKANFKFIGPTRLMDSLEALLLTEVQLNDSTRKRYSYLATQNGFPTFKWE